MHSTVILFYPPNFWCPVNYLRAFSKNFVMIDKKNYPSSVFCFHYYFCKWCMLIKNLEWEKKFVLCELNWKKLLISERVSKVKIKTRVTTKGDILFCANMMIPPKDARRSINWVFKKTLWPVQNLLVIVFPWLLFIPDYYIWCIFACLYININTLTQHLHKNNLLAPMFNWNQIAPKILKLKH